MYLFNRPANHPNSAKTNVNITKYRIRGKKSSRRPEKLLNGQKYSEPQRTPYHALKTAEFVIERAEPSFNCM